MARRGSNSFKRNDAIRALKSARDAGLEPAMMEIVTEDGTTFRIYGDKAVPMPTSECAGADAKAWTEEIEKLKKTPKGR
jgi:hypothetical protein